MSIMYYENIINLLTPNLNSKQIRFIEKLEYLIRVWEKTAPQRKLICPYKIGINIEFIKVITRIVSTNSCSITENSDLKN
jgi:hypothetical protein